jgi:hypothetical protein
MPLSTIVKELSESERRLQIKGQCLKKFTIRADGSVDEEDTGPGPGRVTKEHVSSLSGFQLKKEQLVPFPDHEEEKKKYWSVVREFLKEQDAIRESEKQPFVANADTFAAIMLMPFQSVPKIHVWKDEDVIFLMKEKAVD